LEAGCAAAGEASTASKRPVLATTHRRSITANLPKLFLPEG
jgi:hypothetical protein